MKFSCVVLSFFVLVFAAHVKTSGEDCTRKHEKEGGASASTCTASSPHPDPEAKKVGEAGRENEWGYAQAASVGEGGWSRESTSLDDELHMDDQVVCTIPRRRICVGKKTTRKKKSATTADEKMASSLEEVNAGDCITKKEFRKTYQGKQAVLLSGFMDDWVARNTWTKSNFLNKSHASYGGLTMPAASGDEITFLQGQGYHSKHVSLSEAIQDKNLFAFGRIDAENLLENCSPNFDWSTEFVPESSENTGATAGMARYSWLQLSIGGDGQGLGWHQHGAAYQGLVHGLKRWYLLAPGKASVAVRGHPLLNGSTWEKTMWMSLPAPQRPLSCLQQPGELIYVPSAWAHLTVNVGEAVAVGKNSVLFPPDDEPLLRKAADKGDPEAATHLGDMFGDANMLYHGARHYHPAAALEIISWANFLEQYYKQRVAQLEDMKSNPSGYDNVQQQMDMANNEIKVLCEEWVDILDSMLVSVLATPFLSDRSKHVLEKQVEELLGAIEAIPLSTLRASIAKRQKYLEKKRVAEKKNKKQKNKKQKKKTKKKTKKKKKSKEMSEVRYMPIEEYFSAAKMLRRELGDVQEGDDDDDDDDE